MVTTTTGLATSFIKFSRASNATLTNSSGNIAWAGHNFLSNSESFDASFWNRTGLSSVSANSAVALNGTTTADAIVENSSTSDHWVSQDVSVDPSLITFSVYVKRGVGSRNLFMRAIAQGGADFIGAYFNLGTGAVGATVTGGTGSISSTNIINMGSGWYRCDLIGVFSTSATMSSILVGLSSGTTVGSQNYAGDGTSSLIVWGAHLYRSDLGGMVYNPDQPSGFGSYYSTTPPNLLGNTENYNAATANLLNVTAIGDQAVSPNGLQTADKVNATTTSGLHIVQPWSSSVTTVSGTPYVISAYVKAAEYVKFGIRENSATGAFATFNLVGSGSVISQGSGGTGAITFIGDNWYRVSMLFNAGASSLVSYLVLDNGFTSGDPFGYNYAGNGVSGLYMWGAQFSNSASLDPYVSNPFEAPVASAYYGPRLDFNPSTLICNGILCEEARTNLLTYSADFTNAAWVKDRVSATANSTLAPDGTNTASKITDTLAGNNSYRTYNSVTVSAISYAFTVYAKAAEYSWCYLRIGSLYAWFNVSSGTVGTVNAGLTASVTPVGNGWFRLSCVVATATAGSSFGLVGLTTGNGIEVYTPSTGGQGIHIWGAQLEAGSFQTSYIPTKNSTVTRSVDTSFVASSAFPYSTTEGSFIVSCTTLGGGQINVIRRPFGFEQDGTYFYQVGATYVYDDSAFRVNDFPVNAGKSGVALKTNDFAIVANGAAARTGTGAFTGNQYNILRFGSGMNGGSSLNGHVRNIVYIPRRLTNAELQARTT